MFTPTMFPWDKKASADKKLEHTNVLIPWYPISYLTIRLKGQSPYLPTRDPGSSASSLAICLVL